MGNACSSSKAKTTQSAMTNSVSATSPDNSPTHNRVYKPYNTQTANLAHAHADPTHIDRWRREMRFTKEQTHAMDTFRDRALAANILPPYFDNQTTCFRFCKARDYDVAKAYKMYADHYAWRKTQGLDEMVDRGNGPVPRFLYDYKFAERAQHKAAYNHVHHKVDKLGRLVYYDRAGSLSIKQVLAIDQEEVLKAYIWDCEATHFFRLPACSIAARKHIGKTLTVIDLKGFGLGLLANKAAKSYLKRIIALSQDNYPEMLGKMFIINAPYVFSTLWSFISPMLEQHTRDKISVYSRRSTWLPKLQELVDEADIPAFLGGPDTSLDYVNEQGPWKDVLPDLVGDGKGDKVPVATRQGGQTPAEAGALVVSSIRDDENRDENRDFWFERNKKHRGKLAGTLADPMVEGDTQAGNGGSTVANFSLCRCIGRAGAAS